MWRYHHPLADKTWKDRKDGKDEWNCGGKISVV